MLGYVGRVANVCYVDVTVIVAGCGYYRCGGAVGMALDTGRAAETHVDGMATGRRTGRGDRNCMASGTIGDNTPDRGCHCAGAVDVGVAAGGGAGAGVGPCGVLGYVGRVAGEDVYVAVSVGNGR